MKDITKIIPYAILAVLCWILLSGFLKYRALQNDLDDWRREAGKLSQLYTTSDGLASRRALEISGLMASNEALNDALRKNNETIRSLTELNGTLLDSIENLSTRADTIIRDDDSTEISIRRFDVAKSGFTLGGYFELNEPYRISFEELRAELALEMILSQNEDRVWTTYVTSTNPAFSVDNIEIKVNPYEPGFFEKIKLSAGVYGSASRVGITTGIWYDKHGLMLLMDTKGGALGYQRSFGLKN